MAVEEIGRLRSIAIVGQGGTGKTQLAEAMLFTAGAVTRLGRPDDGTATMDFEPEELSRQESITSSFHHFNWNRNEVIFADTPGYSAFLPDSFATMRAVDAVVFLATPGGDLKVESEKIWEATGQLGLPRIAFVSRLDRERTSFEAAMNDLDKALEAHPIALAIPIGEEAGFKGVIDLLRMKALVYNDITGKPKEEEVGADLKARAEAERTRLCEAVAESDDALLEKYLDKGTLQDEELRTALRAAVLGGKLTPVLCGSGAKNIGVDLRLQDRGRSVRRQTVDFPCGFWLGDERRRRAQLDARRARALRPVAASGRKEAISDFFGAAGRDCRGCQAQGHHNRRHPVRRESLSDLPRSRAAGARDFLRNPAQEQRRRGKGLTGARPDG
jgi:peptide subunit release factor RF-3